MCEPTADAAPPAAATGAGLKPAHYAGRASGERIMAGLQFKLLAGRSYTDLDGRNLGRATVGGA